MAKLTEDQKQIVEQCKKWIKDLFDDRIVSLPNEPSYYKDEMREEIDYMLTEDEEHLLVVSYRAGYYDIIDDIKNLLDCGCLEEYLEEE